MRNAECGIAEGDLKSEFQFLSLRIPHSALRIPFMSSRPPASQSQFKSLRASSLYCSKCKNAMPVRERLLLVLPEKEIYDYLCTGCASSVGQREVTSAEKLMATAAASRQPAPRSSLLLP